MMGKKQSQNQTDRASLRVQIARHAELKLDMQVAENTSVVP
jgi:hypothetical protein